MQEVRNSCILAEECDTPDEVRQHFDDVYRHLREYRIAIQELQKQVEAQGRVIKEVLEKLPTPQETDTVAKGTQKKKGGK